MANNRGEIGEKWLQNGYKIETLNADRIFNGCKGNQSRRAFHGVSF